MYTHTQLTYVAIVVPTPRVQSNTSAETTNTLVHTLHTHTLLSYKGIGVLTPCVQLNTSIETTNTFVHTYKKYTCIHIHIYTNTVNM